MIFITARYHPRPGPDRPNVPSGRLQPPQCSIGPVESGRIRLAATLSCLSSPGGLTARSVLVLHGAGDLAEQRFVSDWEFREYVPHR
jgi:hypothetical protein